MHINRSDGPERSGKTNKKTSRLPEARIHLPLPACKPAFPPTFGPSEWWKRGRFIRFAQNDNYTCLTAPQKVQNVAQASPPATSDLMGGQTGHPHHVTLSAAKGLPLSRRFYATLRMTDINRGVRLIAVLSCLMALKNFPLQILSGVILISYQAFGEDMGIDQ